MLRWSNWAVGWGIRTSRFEISHYCMWLRWYFCLPCLYGIWYRLQLAENMEHSKISQSSLPQISLSWKLERGRSINVKASVIVLSHICSIQVGWRQYTPLPWMKSMNDVQGIYKNHSVCLSVDMPVVCPSVHLSVQIRVWPMTILFD